MWTCPSCGLDGLEEGHGTCPGCGFSRKSYPRLSGAAGEFTLKTSLVFGRKNLASLVGEDAVYAADRQFELKPEGEQWLVRSPANTINVTKLNDDEVTEKGLVVKEGDVIVISSRKNAAVRKAEVRIAFNT